MRRILVPVLILSQLAWSAAALAQETASPPPASGTTTTTTTSTADSTPTASTTTTQATVDAGPEVAVVPRRTETGGSETTTFVNRRLLTTGIVFLGGTYAASAIVASESNRPADNSNLYYPIVGPWMDLAQRDCSALHPCSGEPGNKALLIVDGITQGVGALAILTSFFVPEKRNRNWFIVGSDRLHASPASLGTGYGMVAAGRF